MMTARLRLSVTSKRTGTRELFTGDTTHERAAFPDDQGGSGGPLRHRSGALSLRVGARAFGDVAGAPASIHRVEIEADARTHYHEGHTEIYYVLECAAGAAVELDGEQISVCPGSAVLIPQECDTGRSAECPS